jgi:HEAT repeat protein
MGEQRPQRRRREAGRGATLWVMSTLPIPPDLLARLLDYDEEDEQSSEVHFDRMEEVFAALDSTANRLGLAPAVWEAPDEAVQAHRFDWHVLPLIEAADAVPLEGAGRAGLKLRRAVANALACIVDDARVLGPLLRFARDEDSVVRWQVARGIPVGIDPLPPEAVQTLTVMLHDEDSDVRDWAAFALGVRENDNPELRDALARLLFDADEDTAAEAAYALALRKDPRVLPVLERALAQPTGRLYFEAAAALADPKLLPTLRKLRDASPEDADLERTIVACGG